jgi:hypothetical protein
MGDRKLGPVDKFIQEWGIKHDYTFKKYRPGDAEVTFRDDMMDKGTLKELLTDIDVGGLYLFISGEFTIIEPEEDA